MIKNRLMPTKTVYSLCLTTSLCLPSAAMASEIAVGVGSGSVAMFDESYERVPSESAYLAYNGSAVLVEAGYYSPTAFIPRDSSLGSLDMSGYRVAFGLPWHLAHKFQLEPSIGLMFWQMSDVGSALDPIQRDGQSLRLAMKARLGINRQVSLHFGSDYVRNVRGVDISSVMLGGQYTFAAF